MLSPSYSSFALDHLTPGNLPSSPPKKTHQKNSGTPKKKKLWAPRPFHLSLSSAASSHWPHGLPLRLKRPCRLLHSKAHGSFKQMTPKIPSKSLTNRSINCQKGYLKLLLTYFAGVLQTQLGASQEASLHLLANQTPLACQFFGTPWGARASKGDKAQQQAIIISPLTLSVCGSLNTRNNLSAKSTPKQPKPRKPEARPNNLTTLRPKAAPSVRLVRLLPLRGVQRGWPRKATGTKRGGHLRAAERRRGRFGLESVEKKV